MSKTLPKELQADIKALRCMAIILAVCSFISILGIPWALLYIILAINPTSQRVLKFTGIVTILICWCIVPIFLEVGIWRMIKKLHAYETLGNEAFRSDKQWQKQHFLRKYSPATDMIAVMIILAILLAPLPHTLSKATDIPFTTQNIQDSSLELGDSQTRQAGTNGQGLERHREVKPLFAYILSMDVQYGTADLPAQTTQAPVNQIVAQGTKKYQYMWCSNGSYRYYPNDQFQNPSIGFTHKSPDYCAQNKAGHMTGLADTAPPQQTSQSTYTPSRLSLPTYTTCHDYSFINEFSCTTY